MEQEVEIFEIISHCGDARGIAYDALKAAKQNEIKKAKELLKKSQKELDLAHNTQTKLIQKEINGENLNMSLLMVHAQDQLMTAISEKNLIEQMVDMIGLIYSK
ncbi:PTS system, cellobiose-specific IIA component [Clostridium sp. USBA 49]|uniref:PTS lactose/cellobiose transporter subunit IIA n=1 Tax=Clostridium sp. USBA 49 TaxID=1881060 RepID=UPI0009997DF4|nr:PTS lactose/cellobiose transporter subunit IIA [Clostridium sp. USBA 49]SKA82938.1 PTS system, cellobiose-specific IIA component [Clostridium sp. USBA 49]